MKRPFGSADPARVIVREYGRDSLLVAFNLLVAPLVAALGLRVGLQSEELLVAKIEADAEAMRKKGYLVASTETFHLPVIGAPRASANWYRVTYQLTSDGHEGSSHES